jgi:hypothetical protein
MNSDDETLIVFVDTSYLTYMGREEVADWERLLRMSKDREIDIHLSKIAAEEYRTKRRDDLGAAIGRSTLVEPMDR